MNSSMLTYVGCSCIFFLAGLIQGITGFGAGLVAIPLLAFLIDIKQAVALCILHGLIITGSMAYDLRRSFEWHRIKPLAFGAVPGILVGAHWFQYVDPHWLKLFLGAVLISYSLFNLFFTPKPLYLSSWWGYLAGLVTGFITAIISAGGPPAVIYTTLTGWKKEEMKATLTGFFLINTLFVVSVYLYGGMFNLSVLTLFVISAPFVFLGTKFGSRLGRRIKQRTYLQMTYLLLILMGLLMFRG